MLDFYFYFYFFYLFIYFNSETVPVAQLLYHFKHPSFKLTTVYNLKFSVYLKILLFCLHFYIHIYVFMYICYIYFYNNIYVFIYVLYTLLYTSSVPFYKSIFEKIPSIRMKVLTKYSNNCIKFIYTIALLLLCNNFFVHNVNIHYV